MPITSPFHNAVEKRISTKRDAGTFSGIESQSLPSAPADMGTPGGQRIVQHTAVASPVQGLPSLKPEGRIFQLGR